MLHYRSRRKFSVSFLVIPATRKNHTKIVTKSKSTYVAQIRYNPTNATKYV